MRDEGGNGATRAPDVPEDDAHLLSSPESWEDGDVTAPQLSIPAQETLLAYWRIYSQHKDDLSARMETVAASIPALRAVLEARAPGDGAEGWATMHHLQEAAIVRGDWGPYLADLHARGVTYGRLGVPFADWYQLIAAFRALMLRKLMDALRDQPEGLFRATDGLDRFLQIASSAIGDAYVSTKEGAVRAEQRRQRLILDGALDAIVTIDRHDQVTDWNPEAERMFGWRRAEVLGQSWYEVVLAPNWRGELRHDLDRFRSTGGRAPLDRRVAAFGKRRDGERFPIELALVAIEVEGAIEICAFIEDSTRKREAERAVRHLAAIVQASSDAIVSVDLEGRVLTWNPGAKEMYGHSAEEAVGRRFVPLVSLERSAPDPEWLRHPPQASLHVETVHRRSDGARIDVSLSVSTLWLASGEPVGISVIARDVTRQKRAEQQLARQAKALARSNQELADFAHIASHDLRAPLRAVDNLSRWIEQDLADKVSGETAQHLRLLRSRVQRMDRMIADLLAYSRAGREAVEVEPVELDALVAEVVSAIAPPESFTVRAEATLPALVTARTPLEHVLSNLISNAIKHHDAPGGRILVTAREAGERVEITVADDGPGIAPEHRDQVFRMFQTLKPRDDVEGSGIGLAIVKKTIEAAGGEVRIEDSALGGAAVRFTWPKAWPRQEER